MQVNTQDSPPDKINDANVFNFYWAKRVQS